MQQIENEAGWNESWMMMDKQMDLFGKGKKYKEIYFVVSILRENLLVDPSVLKNIIKHR